MENQEIQKEKYPIVIKVKPYCGESTGIINGKKSIVKIHKDYLEYNINYKQNVAIDKCGEENCEHCNNAPSETIIYNKQEGVILHKNIGALSKYVKPDFNELKETIEFYIVDVEQENGTILTISGEDEKEINLLFKSLKEWILGLETM